MRVKLLTAAAAVSALLLTGCTQPTTPVEPTTNGMEELEADAILEAALDALDEAGSFRVTGEGEVDGGAVEVDLLVVGEDQQGTVTAEGITFELLAVDGSIYFRGDEAMWTSFLEDESLAPFLVLLAGKWVTLPGGDEFAFTTDDVVPADETFTKGEVTEVGGVAAIALESDAGTLYISLVGEPYPLQMETEEGTFSFTDIGEDATIEAPDESDVLDLMELLGTLS